MNFYWGTIAPGQWLWCEWGWIKGNGDHGTFYMAAHPADPNSRLNAAWHSTAVDGNGHYWYGCMIVNDGTQSTGFNIQGGWPCECGG
jgi:hypothetical protein